MKVAIIEDEEPALIRMNELVSNTPIDLEYCGNATTGREAIKLIEKEQPEALFLDIQLPDMNGFEVLANLNYNPYIIFTTAYDQYSLKAFEFHSIDYLVKPIEQERFNQAVQKLMDLQTKSAGATLKQMNDWMKMARPKQQFTFPIKEKDRIVLLNFEEIVFFKSEDKYVNVVLENGKEHLISKTLSQLEMELPEQFYRVHRSYIVNRNFVFEMEKYFKSRFVLKLKDKARNKIQTGEMYFHRVKEIFSL